MKKRKTHLGLDITLFTLTVIAILVFALTFKEGLDSQSLFLIRISSLATLIVSLLYFGITRHTLKRDINLIILLLVIGLFLFLFRNF